jgi:predicted transposase/invertase (TIGR01784 family)
LPESLDNHSIKKAINVLEVMNFNTEERDLYEDHLKWLRIEANTLKKAEEKGKEIGEAIGIIKGKAEGKLEIAKNLITKGFDEKSIFEITGLTIQEVKKHFPDH